MAIPKRIPKFLLNQVAHYRVQEHTPYGMEWGDPKPIKCRFEPSHRTITQPQGADLFGGEEIVARAIMFTEPGTKLPINTRVDYRGETFVVIESAEYPGPNGQIHHIETVLR